MAFNLATFKTRTLTAVVFVIIMVAGLLLSQWSFFLLFTIIHFGCWWEYQKLVMLIDVDYTRISLFHKFGVMIFGWCIMLYFTKGSIFYGNEMAEIGKWLGLALFIGLLIDAFVTKSKTKKFIGHSIFGLIYISLSLALFVKLPMLTGHQTGLIWDHFLPGNWFAHGWELPVFVIGCMWINDTMAYIVGSLIGKRPLSKISPKKTWEGTVGGIILCAIVAGLIGYYLVDGVSFNFYRAEGINVELICWMLIAGVAAVAGTFGDLLESKLKRLAMVKDSGNIMPGHGGFLDRFDSLLLAGPVVAIILWLYQLYWVNSVS